MFEKNLRLAYLLDFYGDVLDDHTRGVMKAYYDDDLSLAEIAEELGISRQGVRHVIKKGEEQLVFLEDRLGLAERNEELCRTLSCMTELIDRLSSHSDEEVRRIAKELGSATESLSNKN